MKAGGSRDLLRSHLLTQELLSTSRLQRTRKPSWGKVEHLGAYIDVRSPTLHVLMLM